MGALSYCVLGGTLPAMWGMFLFWIGGGLARMAATGVAVGVVFLLTGVLPWEIFVELAITPPYWLTNPGTKVALVIIGLVIIFASLHFNVYSFRQKAIDDLAEDLSWAINQLLNRKPRPSTKTEIDDWANDYSDWCDKVRGKLDNRAFFTRADQLHFDRLGFIEPVLLSGKPTYDWWLSQLNLKFIRLRDVINWAQMRRR